MSEIKEYHSSFTGPEVDALLTKVKDGSITADIEKELAEKADKSGRYPEMSVGFADDLVGRGESVPAEFSFRASGGKSIKDGAARIKRLKGNSVVWNQLAKVATGTNTQNGVTIEKNADGSVRVHGEASAANFFHLFDGYTVDIIYGHKYCIGTAPVSNKNINIHIAGQTGLSVMVAGTIYTAAKSSTQNIYVSTAASFNDDITFYPQLFDLTQMFGAGNEPSTIEEFNARKPIVEDEYAYNEGEVIHMTAEGIKSVGDNAWDEEWEVGSFDLTTGDKVSLDSFIRSSNKIKVIPNESYYISRAHPQMYAWLYDNNGNYINYVDLNTSVRTFNFGPNAHYINLRIGSTTEPVTTYNNDIMITLVHSGWKQDTDAGYQPYWEDRLIFDQRIKDEFPDGMSKWDMVYNKNGKGYIVKGTGVVEDMSLLDWDTGFGGFHTSNIRHNIKHLYEYIPSNILCSRLATNLVSSDDVGIALIYGGSADYPYNGNIKIVGYDSLNSLLADLQGIPLYYQLAEPTIIEYDEPFNLDYRVADFGTEQAIAEQSSAPISADIIYQFNAVDMIREHELEIAELQSIIATMQAQLASLASNNVEE